MSSISIFLNSEGVTASLQEEGSISVYTQNFSNNSWEVNKKLAFSLVNSSSILELRNRITNMIQNIGDCRIFVAREVVGQLYSVLEANRFNIYEVEGKPEQFLDSILTLEDEAKKGLTEKATHAAAGYPEETPVKGTYFLNLKEALNADPNLTSKKVLLPFITNKDFEVLEVICDHVPRWFEDEFKRQGLQSTFSKHQGNEYKVVISKH